MTDGGEAGGLVHKQPTENSLLTLKSVGDSNHSRVGLVQHTEDRNHLAKNHPNSMKQEEMR